MSMMMSLRRAQMMPRAKGQPNNEIWYTSTDGNIVEPYEEDAFGVAIKSNTYENGKGVITFDGDVTTIETHAFYSCVTLASIAIPEGVTTIETSAFYACSQLASITIPESMTTIETSAFKRCNRLAKFEGPLATSDQRCIVIDGALAAFAPSELTEYIIPSGVTTIGDGAFADCSNLASITLPTGVKTIGASAFYNCTSLTSITLPTSVKTIETHAFYSCVTLASVTIPKGVTTIGDSAFSMCWSLASVYCKPTTPPTGGSDMFYNNASDLKIYVPMSKVTTYKSARYWRDYASYIVGYDF